MRGEIGYVIVGIALLAGCNTVGSDEYGYKKYGEGGIVGRLTGYSDFHYRDNVWFVSYIGGSGDPVHFSQRNFHKRAAELCNEKGFRQYTLLKSEQAVTGGGSSTFTGVATPLAGGTTMVSGITTTSSGQPQVGGYIECTK